MDFEKLRRHDRAEWESIHNILLGIGIAACREFANRLTPTEIDDLASEAIEVACAKIKKIKPLEASLKAFVSTTAYNRARTLNRSKSVKPHGHYVLPDQQSDDSGESVENKFSQGVIPTDEHPDAEVERAEGTQLFRELLDKVAKEEAALVWSLEVDDTPQKIVAAKQGWGTASVGSRKMRACNTLRKLLRSDPRATQLLEELDLDHYIE